MTLQGIVHLISQNPNYTLTAMYVDASGNVVRYTLIDSGVELPVATIPYNGQIIKKNFRLEVWNTTNGNVTQTVPLSLITSILGNVDYRYGSDFQLVGNNGSVVDFQSVNVVSTSPPLTNLDAWWNYLDAIPPNHNITSDGWPSRINATDILAVTTGIFTQHSGDTSIVFRTSETVAYANLNGGAGYFPADVWIVVRKNNSVGYTNGNILNFNGTTANILAANTNATDIDVDTFGTTLVSNTGSDFFVVRVAEGDAWIYNLLDWTIVDHIAGVAGLSIVTTLTVGGGGAFYLKEILSYSSVLSLPESDLVAKYISDTYSDGMMNLPLVFPDPKPTNT